MDIALWVAQALLAAAFLGAGLLKATQPMDSVREKVGDWVDGFPAPLVRTIGWLEVAAAVGLLLPPLLDVLPWLAPLAAVGLVVTMIGAVVVHGRRSEWSNAAVNVALGLVAVFVAWGRFGPHAF